MESSKFTATYKKEENKEHRELDNKQNIKNA